MIRVEHLTKRYPGHLAVNDLSFEVKRGEVVGVLGPNGAGKTTTMRMLTGYLPATGGQVRVAGYDVFTESREVRRRIGYLPETCPLYPEMRVGEYLRFRARLKGVRGAAVARRVAAVVALCNLGEVQRRIIGQLSKGYRQRVGLAEALVHEPELLILDEPTIGLDPNQIRQVRELIRELAKQHTILLSTHILPEVEMTCERVLIINQGKVVASDTPGDLQGRFQGAALVTAEIRGPEELIRQAVSALPRVMKISTQAEGEWVTCRIECDHEADIRTDLFDLVVQQQWALRELGIERRSLEEVFVALTHGGRAS